MKEMKRRRTLQRSQKQSQHGLVEWLVWFQQLFSTNKRYIRFIFLVKVVGKLKVEEEGSEIYLKKIGLGGGGEQFMGGQENFFHIA